MDRNEVWCKSVLPVEKEINTVSMMAVHMDEWSKIDFNCKKKKCLLQGELGPCGSNSVMTKYFR